jgi:DNA-binding MurR/RpiR family transcriptional regulator
MPFRNRIREIQPDLSPSFTRVAEFCLDHYTAVAFLTVSEFAKTVDVDAAAIVRFAQRLGYRGYPELQDDIREEVKRQLYAFKKPVPASTKPEALFGTALEQMERNLEAMQAALDPEAFKQFVAAIRKAPRIHLVAPGSLRKNSPPPSRKRALGRACGGW